jgi:hypothetical protein
MRYFLDTEFNGFGGALISLALVREDGESLYLLYDLTTPIDPWVSRTVVPRLTRQPRAVPARKVSPIDGAWAIAQFLGADKSPDIIADWPDDVRLFCQAIMTAPGATVPLERLRFDILRVEPYPTELEGAVEHNAWWDAMALRQRIMRHELEQAAIAEATPPS